MVTLPRLHRVVAAGAIVAPTLAEVLMARFVFRPVRNGSGAAMLIASFAVAMIRQVLLRNLISPRVRKAMKI